MSFFNRVVCGGSAMVFAIPAAALAVTFFLAVAGLAWFYPYLSSGWRLALNIIVFVPLGAISVLVVGILLWAFFEHVQKWRHGEVSRLVVLSRPKLWGPTADNRRIAANIVEYFATFSIFIWLLPKNGDLGNFFIGLLVWAGVYFMARFSETVVAIWNIYDKRSLPGYEERRLAASIACICAQALVAGLIAYFGVGTNLLAIAGILAVGIAFVPVSLAIYYQCDPNGRLARYLPWHG